MATTKLSTTIAGIVAGATGATGPTGPTGPAGATGATGPSIVDVATASTGSLELPSGTQAKKPVSPQNG